ncbi:MAG TPA: helix-turn-helix domain-containing protein [Terracidiphilus sp.]
MEVTNSDGHNSTVTPLLYTKIEAAAMLSVSVRTIDNLIASKELPVRRIRKRVLIPRTVLLNFARPNYRKAA